MGVPSVACVPVPPGPSALSALDLPPAGELDSCTPVSAVCCAHSGSVSMSRASYPLALEASQPPAPTRRNTRRQDRVWRTAPTNSGGLGDRPVNRQKSDSARGPQVEMRTAQLD